MFALYQKYRPKNFSEIIGQEHITKTLKNAISSNNIVHAYLFSGIRGTGKTSLARIFAKTINCEKKENNDACNKCPSCISIINNNAIDLIEVDAASYTGIDDIRELIKSAYLLPTKLKYKIFIIDECHQLSKHAINALLKTLEEPPKNVIFILVTTELHKIIPTILSRCQTFTFWKVDTKNIIKKLEKISNQEKINIDNKALEIIALNSGGAVRDSESLLGQVFSIYSALSQKEKIEAQDVKKLLRLIDVETASKLINLIIEQKESDILIYLRNLDQKSIDFQEFIKVLMYYLRQMLVFKITEDLKMLTGLTDEEKIKLQEQVKKFSKEKILNLLKSLIEAEKNIKYSSSSSLCIELAILDSPELFQKL